MPKSANCIQTLIHHNVGNNFPNITQVIGPQETKVCSRKCKAGTLYQIASEASIRLFLAFPPGSVLRSDL
jgi:hypothetical protein